MLVKIQDDERLGLQQWINTKFIESIVRTRVDIETDRHVVRIEMASGSTHRLSDEDFNELVAPHLNASEDIED